MKHKTKARIGVGLIVAGASIFTGGTGYVLMGMEQNWQSDPNVEQFHKIGRTLHTLNNSPATAREFLEDSSRYVTLRSLYQEMESDAALMAKVNEQEHLERNEGYKGLALGAGTASGPLLAIVGVSLLRRREERE